MTNERSMEHWVLESLGIDLTQKEHQDFWIYPQGESHDPEVNKILRRCGGKPNNCSLTDFTAKENGKGKPEYVIRNKKKQQILLIECKSKIKDHQSENLDKPKNYNVDGLLYYSKYFKEEFDVLGLAISGWEKDNCQISFFSWANKQETFDPTTIEKNLV